MKTRVNSRINNIKGKTKNSFLTKKQAYYGCTRNEAIGYCLFHSIYISKKTYYAKKCSSCKRFIVLIEAKVEI